MTTDILHDIQMSLEEEMATSGAKKFFDSVEKAFDKGVVTPASRAIMKQAIEPTAALIAKEIEKYFQGKASSRAIAIKYLAHFEPTVVAYLTLKVVIDFLAGARHGKAPYVQTLATAIGSRLEDEYRFSKFMKENPGYFKAVKQNLDEKNSSYYRQRTVFSVVMKKKMKELPDAWSTSDKLHVGMKCLDYIIQVTGLVQVRLIRDKNMKTSHRVFPSDQTLEWIENYHKEVSLLSPVFFPMVVPPKDWTTPFDGGYYSDAIKLRLVKTRSKNHLQEITNHDMPTVYSAINHLQKTPWKINSQVLEVLNNYLERETDLAILPKPYDTPIPPCPFQYDSKKEMPEHEKAQFLEWKHLANRVYNNNRRELTKRIQLHKKINLANRFKNYDAIYFPYQMDFRGRTYAVPMFLNPQGDDIAKSLLTFANGKPIEDSKAADWLAIHGANLYGVDKVSFEERIEWVCEFAQTAIKIAEDPYTNWEWMEADSPWQFLAWCFEWAQFEKEGLGFISYLPVALDGSCNGLQHFSAMLRDPIGGLAVNLMPSEKPQDIYQKVADVVTSKLEEIVKTPGEDSEKVFLAQKWLEFGIDRSMTKRSVMVMPYGGTLHSCFEYAEEAYLAKKASQNPEFEFGTLPVVKAYTLLAKLIWESIGEVVIAARKAMDWLRAVAKAYSAQELPINWITPSGFPVQQAYTEVNSRIVKTVLNGSLVYLKINDGGDKVSQREQINGISPNFVHSLDASSLHIYLDKMKGLGVESFSMIHDSYGTLAADAELSSRVLRESFVETYRDHDSLQELYEEAKELLGPDVIPVIPDKYSLDLNQVLESKYFFA